MTSRVVLAIALLSATATVSGQQPAARWWSHVEFLASDAIKGRDTGTAEHRKAAEYIADQFKRAGLEPAPSVEAPPVFAGYGLQVPEVKHDDLELVAEVANRPTGPQWEQD